MKKKQSLQYYIKIAYNFLIKITISSVCDDTIRVINTQGVLKAFYFFKNQVWLL